MPLSDDVFAASSNPAVPGGSFAKPLILALLALLAAHKFGGGGGNEEAAKEELPDFSLPELKDFGKAESPDVVSDGLGELADQFRKSGFGDAIDSWIGAGENKPVQTREVDDALGGDFVDELSKRTGLSRDQVLDGLAKVLPGAVDRMTPDARVPSAQDLFRLMS